MTDPYPAQQPQQPYPQGQPSWPTQQYQPPIGDPAPQPTGFITGSPAGAPPKRSRKPLIVAAAAAAGILLLVVAGLAVYDGFIKEDSGIAMCKAMRDGKNIDGSTDATDDDKMTEAEYLEARELFEDSRHEKIREHGTALIDIAWQITQMPDADSGGALAFIGPMGTHVSGLQTACADQGIIVNLNSDK
ncbi:hypothetical protein ACIBTV_29650 [Micromonospora sp. NPDC049366]|uniref:hypothetical protein n=1 Tax=Micromonospora sp. NPDC049366 TaxID=3364271 RepID=UPI0037992282